jgi:hypothetical protein
MTKEEIWKLLLPVLSGISVVGGFIYWHFKTLNSFKDDIHRLELQFKDLEKNDKLQQQTIDQLREFYPLLRLILEKMKKI